MKLYQAELTSQSPISFSKHYSPIDVPFLDKESHADYDARTWRERAHYDVHGMVFIPPMMVKNAVSAAAVYLSIKIPGKGQSTYTKHIESGLMVTDPIPLGLRKDDLLCETLYVPSDGRRGGTKRVDRTFPIVHNWKGLVTLRILDETVTAEILKYMLEQAGQFIGLGRFRPRNNGYYGRFGVSNFKLA